MIFSYDFPLMHVTWDPSKKQRFRTHLFTPNSHYSSRPNSRHCSQHIRNTIQDTLRSLFHEFRDYVFVDGVMRARAPEIHTKQPYLSFADVLFGAVPPSYIVHRIHGAHCSSPPPRKCGWYSFRPFVDPKSDAQQGVPRFHQVLLSAFYDMMNLAWKRIRLQGRMIGLWLRNRSSFGSAHTTQNEITYCDEENAVSNVSWNPGVNKTCKTRCVESARKPLIEHTSGNKDRPPSASDEDLF